MAAAKKKTPKKKMRRTSSAPASVSASMAHARLKERHRAYRENQEYNLRMRVHRSLSWLERATKCEDLDGKLIFLWIAFNATYARDSGPKEHTEQHDERKTYGLFFKKLWELDKKDKIGDLLWNEFGSSIRGLLDNRYIHRAFWKHQRGEIDGGEWESSFRNDKEMANECLKRRSTPGMLNIVFSAIYVLRNQLVHGGATWGGDVNREQIRDSARFMEKFVIAMLDIMVEEKEFQWENVPYPPVDWNR